MKDLQIFRLDNLNVRVYGEWFVGKDVAEGLGYAKTEIEKTYVPGKDIEYYLEGASK